MASVYDYTFNRNTRIGNDFCDNSQKNIQNSTLATYNLNNYFPACPMSNPINFATSQPAIMYNGSHQVGINGCNINENSQLKYTELSRKKAKLSLEQRPYLTVPYLGRGKTNVDFETNIRYGDYGNNKKSTNLLSEKSYIEYHQTPMLKSLQETVSNPSYLIENSAAEGWIRGGLPSRELTRDKDYNNSRTEHQYI